jgi:hypothetical protein
MAAGLAQRGPAEQVPGSGRQAFPDRLGQARVAAARIPDRGEPAAQRAGQPPRPGQGQVTQRAGLDLQQAEAGAVGVEVRIDQAGDDRTAAAVDDPVARPGPSATSAIVPAATRTQPSSSSADVPSKILALAKAVVSSVTPTSPLRGNRSTS